MLANTYQIPLASIGSNAQLSNLVRNFAISAPKVKRKIPSWSLNYVLSYLKKAEPLTSLSLKRLTVKVLFLVSLALARRVGELHALSPDISFQKHNLVLHLKEGFLAKTESALNPLPRSFTLKALRESSNTAELDNTLCPVRCLL